MLYLQSSLHSPPQTVFHSSNSYMEINIPEKWLDHKQKNTPIAVFFKSSNLYVMGNVNNLSPSPKLEINYIGQCDFKIKTALFSVNNPVIFPDTFSERFKDLNNALSSAPAILNIHHSEQKYIFDFIDPLVPHYSQAVMNDGRWKDHQKYINIFIENINIAIRSGTTRILLQLIEEGQNILKDLLNELNLPLFQIPPGRQLQVYLPDLQPFLPLEYLPGKPLIQYLLPQSSQYEKKTKIIKKISVIYSPQLEHALKEVNHLSGKIKNCYELELFSDQNYEHNRNSIKNTHAFHFIGHGKIENGKSGMILDEHWTSNIETENGVQLVVFDCCHIGKVPDGIISNLISKGGDYVIASPYEIADDHGLDFERLYLFLNPGDVLAAYALTSFSQPLFYYYNRLYSFFHR